VALSERLAAPHEKAQQRYVRAPVFGGLKPPPQRSCSSCVGRPELQTSACRFFAALGQKTFRIADRPAAANLVKLSGNFSDRRARYRVAGEAIALVSKAGMTSTNTGDAHFALLYGPGVQKLWGHDRRPEFEPAGFARRWPEGYTPHSGRRGGTARADAFGQLAARSASSR